MFHGFSTCTFSSPASLTDLLQQLTMYFTIYLTALAAPIAAFAAPTANLDTSKALAERQITLVKPPPCIRSHTTTPRQTKKRSNAFAHAFIYKQDITKAFTYIVSDYIVLLPHPLQ